MTARVSPRDRGGAAVHRPRCRSGDAGHSLFHKLAPVPRDATEQM